MMKTVLPYQYKAKKVCTTEYTSVRVVVSKDDATAFYGQERTSYFELRCR